jgi:threonine aldolase
VIDKVTPEQVLAKLSEHNIKAIKFGAQEIRFVTHLDFDDLMLEKTVDVIKRLSF